MTRVAYPGKNASRVGDSVLSTLPLILYLALSVGLMVADHRAAYGSVVRQGFSLLVEPFWWVASTPVRAFRAAREGLALRGQLQDHNTRLRRDLEIAAARIHRLNAVAEENVRLRQLLGGTQGYRLNARMAGIVDIDLDPFRQRLVLDTGSEGGVELGQALIDSGGVLGQVIEVGKNRSIALLVTDPDHAVPVQVARSGLRAIAFGTGHVDRLKLPNISQNADIRAGDLLVTSGIGGHFPAGFPVGVVTALYPDSTRLFVVAEARPAAHLERGIEVLLISNLPPAIDVGPPAPMHPATTAPATPAAPASAAPEQVRR